MSNWKDDEGGFVNTWKDVRDHFKNKEPLPVIPDGMEVVPVVGLTFVEGYPENILTINKLQQAKTGDIYLQLVRNPENPYDSNAVEVRLNQQMLGHLPRDIAARVAPIMDQGYRYIAVIHQVRISSDNPNNPGLDILVVTPEYDQ